MNKKLFIAAFLLQISFAFSQISFIAKSTKFNATLPLTINKPAGVLANDVLIAHITSRIGSGGTVGMTPPAGWTLIRMIDSAGLQMNTIAFYKIAGASEPANYPFTNGGTASLIDNLGGISVYRGADAVTPIDVESGWFTPIGNYTTQSVTTNEANAMIVVLFASDGSSASWTPPSGMAERYDTNAVQSSWRSITSADALQTAMGATGQKTAATTGGGSATGIIIALKPPGTTLVNEINYSNHKPFLYPNPAKDEISVELFSPCASASRILITDMMGKITCSLEINLQKGNNMYKIPVEELVRGMYFISVEKSGAGVQKFIKE